MYTEGGDAIAVGGVESHLGARAASSTSTAMEKCYSYARVADEPIAAGPEALSRSQDSPPLDWWTILRDIPGAVMAMVTLDRPTAAVLQVSGIGLSLISSTRCAIYPKGCMCAPQTLAVST